MKLIKFGDVLTLSSSGSQSVVWGPLMVLKRLWRICKVSNIFILIFQCCLHFSLSFSPYCTVKFSSGYNVICCYLVTSFMPDSLQPHCPWNFPSKLTGVGRHFLLQGIFPTQGSNWHLLHCKQVLSHWATKEAPMSHQMVYRCRYENPNSSIKPNAQEIYRNGK